MNRRRGWIRFCLLILCCSACSSSEEGITVTGDLLFNGRPQAGELIFEAVETQTGGRRPSVSVIVPESGRFRVVLPERDNVSAEFRILVRLAVTGESGLPAAFDPGALPEKTVELKRILHEGQHLTLAVTQ